MYNFLNVLNKETAPNQVLSSKPEAMDSPCKTLNTQNQFIFFIQDQHKA